MNEIRVVPTANAGAILYLGGFCVWTDVLNEANQGGYEVLSDEAFRRILREPAFRPDAVLFTHRHHDHYSEERVMKAAEAWPDALIYVGGASPGGKELDLTASHGTLRIRTIPLPHDGVRYAEVLNEAFLLLSPAGNVLISGDCPVACPELQGALGMISRKGCAESASDRPEKAVFPIDLALLNFPWLSLGKGRKAISSLDPDHVLFFHLPAPSEDRFGYRTQAERMLETCQNGRDWRITGRPFEEERFLLS